MTHRRRRTALLTPLIAAFLLAGATQALAEDFEMLPMPGEDAFPALPDEDDADPSPFFAPTADDGTAASGSEAALQAPDAGATVRAPTPEPIASPPVPSTADEAFDLRAKALEERVNDLKEKIFRTKYRLSTLAATVLGGLPSSGAKLALSHKNELGSSYVLVSAAYTLDGAPLYTKVDESGALDEKREFLVFDQRIAPGQHQISVQYELRGHGYGVFSYLEGMRLTLRSSHTFTVEPGKITRLTSLVHEKAGLTLEFADKPDVRFEMNVIKDIGAGVDEEGLGDVSALGVATDGMP